MSIVSLPEILEPAYKQRYGVAAFNAVDAITLDGLIKGAEASRAPLIVQVSVSTIKYWGAEVFKAMFIEMARKASVPLTLHLDHCPDPAVAKTCLELGWNSVLFDGSGMGFEENFRHTREIVALAKRYGACVEGEVVAVSGVEDGVGSDEEGELVPLEKEIAFIKETGIYSYAPPIGTAHGFYKAEPTIRYDRIEALVAATDMPMVLHGGSGLTEEVFRRLISLGAAKVNISTDLKKVFADGFRNYLAAKPTEYNPLRLIKAVREDVTRLVSGYCRIFGSEGKA
jgi:fructose-bisphosphate aldolase class II